MPDKCSGLLELWIILCILMCIVNTIECLYIGRHMSDEQVKRVLHKQSVVQVDTQARTQSPMDWI